MLYAIANCAQFNRQLLKDFDAYAKVGFLNSICIVPHFYINKEDAVSQAELNFDWSDPEKVSK